MALKFKYDFFLIDHYNLLFRVYYAFPSLTSPAGELVGGVYGCSKILFDLRLNIPNTSLLVSVSDYGGANFRHEIFPEYKANRPESPEFLVSQVPKIKNLLKILGIPYIAVKGFEADDIIASYSREAVKLGKTVLIISADKDLMQLVNDSVHIYDPLKKKIFKAADVVEKYNVPVDNLVDLFSLAGDASDNIPGIPGVGLKKGATLINKFKTIDNLANNLDSLPDNKTSQSIISHIDKAQLARELISLKVDINHLPDLSSLKQEAIDIPELKLLYVKNNFKSLMRTVDEYSHHLTKDTKTEDISPNNTRIINSLSEIKIILKDFLKEKELFIYILEYQQGKIRDPEHIYVLLSDFQDKNFCLRFPVELFNNNLEVQNLFSTLLSDKNILKITFDVQVLLALLHKEDKPCEGLEDLLLLSYVSYGDKHPIDLIGLFFKRLAEDIAAPHWSLNKKNEPIKLENVDVSLYATKAKKLFNLLTTELTKDSSLSAYITLEKNLINVLHHMYIYGFLVDEEKLINLSIELDKNLYEAECKIFAVTKREFNIASPKQVAEVLYNDLSLSSSYKRKNKSGNYSTNVKVLEKLAIEGVEVAGLILHWRTLNKLKSTYTEGLRSTINPMTNAIHSYLLSASTNTGRLNSMSPNLQNIPLHGILGDEIRSAFIAPEGYSLISLDYSQIELRILAELANVSVLRKAFVLGEDIHAATARELLHIPADEKVADDVRKRMKAINFGIIYGLTAYGLAERLRVSIDEANDYIEKYHERYPEVKNFIEETLVFARKNRYVLTKFNRKCYIEDINSGSHLLKQMAERSAINAPIQGTAADIMRLSMVKIYNDIIKVSKAQLVLQVHDELLVQVLDDEVHETALKIKNIMENTVEFSVPMDVNIAIGKTWGSLTPVVIK